MPNECENGLNRDGTRQAATAVKATATAMWMGYSRAVRWAAVVVIG